MHGDVPNVQQAAHWLRLTLQHGPLRAVDVHQLAQHAGYDTRTIQRARKRAGVTIQRHGFGPGSHLVWQLTRAPHWRYKQHPQRGYVPHPRYVVEP